MANINPQKLLLLNLGQLGDVVLSLPAMQAIRRRFPHAEITAMTGVAAGEVLELSGLVDEVIPVDRVALRDGVKRRSIARVFEIVRDVRRRRFDMAIDLRSLWETNLLAALSGARWRLFASRSGRSLDLFATIRTPREDHSRPLAQSYLDNLAPLGIDGKAIEYRLPTRDADSAFVAGMLQEHDVTASEPLVGLFPGAGHPDRRWPLDRFAELASLLSQNGLRTVVILGPEERTIVADARAIFPSRSVLLDRPLTISQLASLAASLDLLVSNDTGPAHIAAAVGTRTVIPCIRHPRLEHYAPLGSGNVLIASASIAQVQVADVYAAVRFALDPAARVLR